LKVGFSWPQNAFKSHGNVLEMSVKQHSSMDTRVAQEFIQANQKYVASFDKPKMSPRDVLLGTRLSGPDEFSEY
jgi:hypothetical protein